MVRVRRLAVVVLLASIASVAVPLFAQGGGRTDYLVRLLRTSPAFRVRAQAALSLGAGTTSPPVISALSDALRTDTDASVRAACAQSFERLRDPSALPALRAAARDSSPDVRTAVASAIRVLERLPAGGGGTAPPGGGTAPPGGGTAPPTGTPRYYVGVGQPGTKVASISPEVLRGAHEFLRRRAQTIEGVVIAPDGETPPQANRVIRDRHLTGFFLDASITSLEVRPDGGVRAAVSVIVQTYPDRNVRSMLSGAATVMGETGAAAQQHAIEAALTGALRNLGTAMSAGAPR